MSLGRRGRRGSYLSIKDLPKIMASLQYPRVRATATGTIAERLDEWVRWGA